MIAYAVAYVMKLRGIINSLLDIDKYKYTMMYWIFCNKPNAMTEWSFKCRTKGVNLVQFIDEINAQLDHLCTLTLSTQELSDLHRKIPELSHGFLKYLSTFKLKRELISVYAISEHEIEIKVTGKHLENILFEIFVLSIVHEVYDAFTTDKDVAFAEGKRRLQAKIDFLNKKNLKFFKFSDFGTRRRYSHEWQDYVISQLKDHPNFAGTSNIYFAIKYDLPCIGTMAHEYLQTFQSYGPNLRDFQKNALTSWITHFGGKLGIALSDVIGMDAFLRDFDFSLATAYQGARHDSGDPYIWTEKLIKHYQQLGIDPATKTAVYSDGLTVYSAVDLYLKFDCHEVENGINTFAGIGTSLTNDMGCLALNIVLKIVECEGLPVAKLSDSPGKEMCKSPEHVALLRLVNNIH